MIGYLGPEGTFTHQAAQLLCPEAQLVPIDSQREGVRRVEEGALSGVVLPIDNSAQGPVMATWTALLESHLTIVEDVTVEVAFDAFICSTAEPKKVISHPHALAQCQKWLEEINLPTSTANSTAAACRDLQPGEIAIASRFAGQLYNLSTLCSNVEDRAGAVTHFALFEKKDLTTTVELKPSQLNVLAVVPAVNTPGMLLSLLKPFARRQLNLVNLVTMPISTSDREVLFLLFVENATSHLPSVLAELKANDAAVVNLGGLNHYARSQEPVRRTLPLRLQF